MGAPACTSTWFCSPWKGFHLHPLLARSHLLCLIESTTDTTQIQHSRPSRWRQAGREALVILGPYGQGVFVHHTPTTCYCATQSPPHTLHRQSAASNIMICRKEIFTRPVCPLPASLCTSKGSAPAKKFTPLFSKQHSKQVECTRPGHLRARHYHRLILTPCGEAQNKTKDGRHLLPLQQ